VIDLYAIGFDPVFRDRDVASYTAGDIPADILELMDLRARVMNSCRWPLQRWAAARALRGKSPSQIAALIRAQMPKDVLAQQEKVAWADGLAFIAPVHFCSFPAILKGWIDRVWTLDFAYGLTSAGWHGDVNGRIPLLHHRRALIMTSTIFDKNAYDDGHPRRHRQGHRRLGLPLPRHRRRRTRLLLRRHIRHPGPGQAVLPAGL
jgi:NAD(P)H dehydrogenase (quinone)